MTEARRIGEKRCLLWGDPTAERVLLHLTGEHEGEDPAKAGEAITALAPGKPFLLVQCCAEDWNGALSPWPAPAVFGDRAFAGGGAETLRCLREDVLPAFSAGGARKYYLGGYSLAGLFSLWAAYRMPELSGVAAVSPSVWYPGWAEFAEKEKPRVGRIYLSLGLREEKTRNRTMAAVGDNLRRQYALLTGAGTDCTLVWNPGGHFSEPLQRTAAGFAWLLRE